MGDVDSIQGVEMYLDELTKDEFESQVGKGVVVILPFGAVEEHGAHLPLATDSIQPIHVAEEVARRTGALIAPQVRYGLCSSTRRFPGTLSLTFDTVRALATDILSELVRNGVRRVMVLSGHAGRTHMAALKLAAEAVVRDHPDLRVAVLSDYDIVYERAGELDGLVPPDDGHAGMIETSRVMAIRPDLVKGQGVESHPDFPPYRVLADPERYFPSGIMGDPTGSNPEIGERINRIIVDRLVELVNELKKG